MAFGIFTARGMYEVSSSFQAAGHQKPTKGRSVQYYHHTTEMTLLLVKSGHIDCSFGVSGGAGGGVATIYGMQLLRPAPTATRKY